MAVYSDKKPKKKNHMNADFFTQKRLWFHYLNVTNFSPFQFPFVSLLQQSFLSLKMLICDKEQLQRKEIAVAKYFEVNLNFSLKPQKFCYFQTIQKKNCIAGFVCYSLQNFLHNFLLILNLPMSIESAGFGKRTERKEAKISNGTCTGWWATSIIVLLQSFSINNYATTHTTSTAPWETSARVYIYPDHTKSVILHRLTQVQFKKICKFSLSATFQTKLPLNFNIPSKSL